MAVVVVVAAVAVHRTVAVAAAFTSKPAALRRFRFKINGPVLSECSTGLLFGCAFAELRRRMRLVATGRSEDAAAMPTRAGKLAPFCSPTACILVRKQQIRFDAIKNQNGGSAHMPSYLLQVSYTAESLSALIGDPQNRADAVRKPIEVLGGRVISSWFSFGEYDLIAVVEMPDNVSAAAFVLAISAGGSLRTVRTMPLLTLDEGLKAMKLACASGYEPVVIDR
jgi:uncharacterized protein with GYD domain